MKTLLLTLSLLCWNAHSQIILRGGTLRGATLGVVASTPAGCTPSYANTGGKGDRSAVITVTSGGGGHLLSGGTAAQYLVNNEALANISFFDTAVLDSSKFIQFDFLSGHTAVITEATYFQQDSTAEGVWQWEGSNDASTWTPIGSSFTLGGATSQVITTLSGNTTPYRYYHIIGVSGATNNSPFVYLFWFKLCYT